MLIEVVKTTSATCVADGPMGNVSTSSANDSRAFWNPHCVTLPEPSRSIIKSAGFASLHSEIWNGWIKSVVTTLNQTKYLKHVTANVQQVP